MPRAARVERTCLVCEETFTGTPAATRCTTCKAAGLRVPVAKQAQRGKTPKTKVSHDLTCTVCEEMFTSPRSTTKRCRSCIETGRRQPHVDWREKQAREFLKELEAERRKLEDLRKVDREEKAQERKRRTREKMALLYQIVEYRHPTSQKRKPRRSAKVIYLQEVVRSILTQHHPLDIDPDPIRAIA